MIEIGVAPNLAAPGAFVLSWHGIFSFIAVATAVFLVGRWAPSRGIDPDDMYSIAIFCIIGGVVGARLVHVVDNASFYWSNPTSVIAIWRGGIAIWGGVLGGFVGGAGYSLWMKHPVGIIADMVAPTLLLAQNIGRLGDIVNGEHCAKATDFFLGIVYTNPESDARGCDNGIEGAVHPAIVYEMAWNFVSLLVVWKLRGRLRPDGMLFAVYLLLYSLGRFTISFARTESSTYAFGLVQAQVIGLLIMGVVAVILIAKARPIPASEVVVGDAPAPQPRGTRAQRRRRRR